MGEVCATLHRRSVHRCMHLTDRGDGHAGQRTLLRFLEYEEISRQFSRITFFCTLNVERSFRLVSQALMRKLNTSFKPCRAVLEETNIFGFPVVDHSRGDNYFRLPGS